MSKPSVVKNSFANLCRGSAAALVTLLLPPFLTRILDKDTYGTWLLILQLSTYVSFLDFGVQTAVGRYVAHHNELGETQKRDGVVSTSLAILCILGVIALIAISLLAFQLPNLFNDMPPVIRHDAQWSLLIVGGSLAISLPFTVFGAIFVGLQRYDIPAWIIGSSKLLSGVLVVLIAYSTHNIVWMAVGMGLGNLLGGLAQYIAYRKLASDICVVFTNISKKSGIEITKYCSSLLVWSVGMLLVSGLDVAIIGHFDYKSVIYYTLAASLTSFVMGIQSSVLTTIMPKAAKIGATGDKKSLGNLLLSANRYALIILIMTSFPLIFSARYILTLWLGGDYASNIEILLQLLVLANCIRQIGAPYAIIAIAVGEQKIILLSPIMEGVLNLFISVVLTARLGVIGVAIGTLVSAVFSVVMNFCYNLPRTKSILLPENTSLLYESIRLFSIIFPVPFIWLLYICIARNIVSSSFDIMVCISAIISLMVLTYMRILTKGERNVITTKFLDWCTALT